MNANEKDAMALDQMRVASKHLRIPGTEGLPAGPRTADELDKACAHLASRIAELEAAVVGLHDQVDQRDRELDLWQARATRAEAELAAKESTSKIYSTGFIRGYKNSLADMIHYINIQSGVQILNTPNTSEKSNGLEEAFEKGSFGGTD